MKPVISIIVPVYNVERWIGKCIDSIINQTYKNLEIILVDDGSPDNCPAICDEYAEKDKRIKVIHKKNGGLSDARNAGLEIATGEYIGFVDSDDWIEKDMFEYLADGLTKYDADISICNIINVYNFKTIIDKANMDVVVDKYEGLERLFSDRLENYAWNKLYKRDCWKGVRFPKGKNFEDVLTIYKTFERSKRIAILDEAKYHYLRRDDSISGNKDFSNRMHIYEAFIDRYEEVAPRFPQYKCQLFSRFRKWYINELCDMVVNHPEQRGENLALLEIVSAFVSRNKDDIAATTHISQLEKRKWDSFSKGSVEGCTVALKLHHKQQKSLKRKKKLKKIFGV